MFLFIDDICTVAAWCDIVTVERASQMLVMAAELNREPYNICSCATSCTVTSIHFCAGTFS